ncbi:cyclin-domain-containing protein [Yamadazyma tenuis ATCC 10573]|uniref:Cyclin-domain-containing protein n=2 Tax=Candida tenuis TaxID=2315449 RepID=G3B4Y2_CANTC|nr:cyclin-domain-containing protein [Yamadazyma tenuis ATCC 10573]EGV64017.1 cyclin-domain-containing protein [Yamadazyma tenuis ATCC 10573]
MVSSSYSSNNSYNKYSFRPSHSIPTTNLNVDNNVIPNFQHTSGSTNQNLQQHQHQQQRPSPLHQHSFTTSDNSLTNIVPTPPQAINYVTEPDHYMTYGEFFSNLSLADGNDEEHINIVDYPVNDLILMLSCLLTKIIEANDKLHPNHFDSTIAIRQKLKEEKRQKKLQRKQHHQHQEDLQQKQQDPNRINVNESIIEDDSSDGDEEDEMKNRYLANVLAFHGTNVPGISLHAYLSRVLKYCPVTNEVFLSLLVYFDRIAKKANNLKKEGDPDGEQLFVMDSYNIHRLIISGITVSSKFFSDIFYKNLRYAKVGGLPLEELNYLELQFLLLLDFKLMISVEDLQNYGDLLLRFWKREQITNELVHNTSIDTIPPSTDSGSQLPSQQSNSSEVQPQPQQTHS